MRADERCQTDVSAGKEIPIRSFRHPSFLGRPVFPTVCNGICKVDVRFKIYACFCLPNRCESVARIEILNKRVAGFCASTWNQEIVWFCASSSLHIKCEANISSAIDEMMSEQYAIMLIKSHYHSNALCAMFRLSAHRNETSVMKLSLDVQYNSNDFVKGSHRAVNNVLMESFY